MKTLFKIVISIGLLSQLFTGCNHPANRPDGNRSEILTSEESLECWKDAKFGMFIHWGLYAITAGTWKNSIHEKGYSEWIMFHEQIPVKEYEELAEQFNPVEFDAERWVQLAKAAGMKYMIITAKHHDGFSMFDTKVSDYDIVDRSPFKRDVVKELMEACQKHGLKFGCYYSVDRDWYHPLCGNNVYNEDNVWDYPDEDKKDFDTYFDEFAVPQIKELLNNYNPDIIWFDGLWMKSDAQMQMLYKMIKSKRPHCLVNSRIKSYEIEDALPLVNCDYLSMYDNYISEEFLEVGWENPGTMNTSYGYNKNDQNWHPTKRLIYYLVDIASKGGNYLLNVGPTDKGVIQKASSDRLLEMGEWLETNREAIYHTTHWEVFGEGPVYDRYLEMMKEEAMAEESDEEDFQEVEFEGEEDIEYNAQDIRFTQNGNNLYAICLDWPATNVVIKSLRDDAKYKVKEVNMLGSDEVLSWEPTDEGLLISVPKEKPCKYAFVYRIVLKE